MPKKPVCDAFISLFSKTSVEHPDFYFHLIPLHPHHQHLPDTPSFRFSSSSSSVQLLSRVRLFATPWTAAHQLPCASPTPGVYSNSCPLSRWCHLTSSPSVVPFSSHLQSFPVSGFFQMSQFFTSGGQNIGVSASASLLLMNIQVWFPLGSIGWISLLSKGLSRVFSNTTDQRHQFFDAQLSL